MKYLYIILTVIIFGSQSIIAQTFPETFNYQAVARNDDGTVVANSEIVVEVTILQGDNCDNGGTCNTIWQELHYPTTSDFGLFSINIGEGQTTFNGSATDFASIDWTDFTSGSYYLKLRVDFGASGYVNGLIDVGTVKLQSVPYSFSSENAQDLVRTNGKVPISINELLDVNSSTIANNDVLAWNGFEWTNTAITQGGAIAMADITDVSFSALSGNQVLTFDGTSTWSNSTLSTSFLSDFNTAGATSGQAIIYDGTNWVNTSLSVNNISEFSSATPNAGDALVWDGAQWVVQAPGGGSSVWTDDGTYTYYNGGNSVGIGTATPTTALQYSAVGNGGFSVVGTYNATGNIDDLGAGSRMMFYPSTGSFRAGVVDGTQWNNANTGDYSAAFGLNSTANGSYSLVAGRDNIAQSSYCVTFGYNNETQGVSSFAAGTGNIAVGLNSFVVGSGNNQTAGLDADNSIVGGSGNNAYSSECLVVGTNNDAQGQNSIVFGENSKTDANAKGGLAGGFATTARGNYSVTFGEGTTANAFASLVIGQYNNLGTYNQTGWTATDAAFIIGNGADAGNRNNALVMRKNGDIVTETGVYGTAANPSKGSQIDNYKDILNIEGIYFDDGKVVRYGLNTNQVETYFPSLITDFNNGKAINYTGFIPMMIETIQDQQSTIEDLKHENLELKQQLQDFEIRLQALENN